MILKTQKPLGTAFREDVVSFRQTAPLTEPSPLRDSFSAMSERLASKSGINREAAALQLTKRLADTF